MHSSTQINIIIQRNTAPFSKGMYSGIAITTGASMESAYNALLRMFFIDIKEITAVIKEKGVASLWYHLLINFFGHHSDNEFKSIHDRRFTVKTRDDARSFSDDPSSGRKVIFLDLADMIVTKDIGDAVIGIVDAKHQESLGRQEI